MSLPIEPINWNKIEDQVDKDVWDKLVQQFWLDTKIPLSNDLKTWGQMSDAEKDVTRKVLVGLTALDTIQGRVGAVSMMPDAITPHEADVLTNIAFMEAFAEGTQVLTSSGWKNVEDISESDLVAQYLPNSGEVEFVNPEVVSHHTSKSTYHVFSKPRKIGYSVSGGHRIFYRRKSSDGTMTNTVDSARDLYVNGMKSKKNYVVSGGLHKSGKDSMTTEEKIKVISTLVGKVVGHNDEEGYGVVHIRVQRLNKRARAEEFFEKENIPYTKYHADTFAIAIPDEWGFSEDNNLSWIDLSQVSHLWALEFFSLMSEWCASDVNKPRFETTSAEDAGIIMALGSLCNTWISMAFTNPAGTQEFYRLFVTLDPVESNFHHNAGVDRIDEPSEVYAIQVPSTYLIVRGSDRHSPVVTGNCVHAKSYSSIFSTLITSDEIKDTYRWASENPLIKAKMDIVMDRYLADDPLKRKIASTLLESFLFYSGFFWPLYLSSRGKLTNTADIIRLILADESVHGFYIGYKYQRGLGMLDPDAREEYKTFTYDLLQDLYDNEVKYTRDIYDEIGLTDQVLPFLRYNANKALANLGYEPLFPSTSTEVNASVLSALSPNGGESHDFFSGSGSSYAVGVAEDIDDSDWEDMFD